MSYLQRGGHVVISVMCLFLVACTGVPDGIEPVTAFDQNRYLGTWHEIARLDHRFERGLSQVTATYRTNPDGSIAVLNRGFDSEKSEWRETEGVARFVQSPDVAHLKVSFFGPFYGSYIIFELDESDYQYAFVAGNTTDYLWLLARTPTIDEALKTHFIERADALGFDSSKLIFVDQTINKKL